RLKSALWLAVGRIVDEESIRHGVDATPQFIGALTEMVWTQIGTASCTHVVRIKKLKWKGANGWVP
ncbi:hypothetical protein KEM55_008688, partial [Ascosphaera atra]